MLTEKQARARLHGKWSQAGVPHRGWTCDDIVDLGEPSATCEMCESVTIRWVHLMSHPRFDGALEVGQFCAGHMQEDKAGARERENWAKSRIAKRARWVDRRWKTSQNGRLWLRADGYRVVVWESGRSWGASIFDVDTNERDAQIRGMQTERDAKLGAFDRITALLKPSQL